MLFYNTKKKKCQSIYMPSALQLCKKSVSLRYLLTLLRGADIDFRIRHLAHIPLMLVDLSNIGNLHLSRLVRQNKLETENLLPVTTLCLYNVQLSLISDQQSVPTADAPNS